jgi:hypothetical protein
VSKLPTIQQIKKTKEDAKYWLEFERHRQKFDSKISKVCKLQFEKEQTYFKNKAIELAEQGQQVTIDRLFDNKTYEEWTFIIKKIYEIVGKYFFDRQIKELEKQMRKKSIKQDNIFIFDELNRLRNYVLGNEVMTENINDLYIRIVDNPQTQEDRNNNFWYTALLTFLFLYLSDKVNYVVDNTREKLKTIIQDNIKNGGNIDSLNAEIDMYYNKIKTQRSNIITATEVAGASNFGNRTASDILEIPLKHIWISTMDTRVRDIHIKAHGQTLPKEEPFIVGGERLKYPHDTSLGATAKNIINCRCVEKIIIDTERLGGR